MVKRFFASNPKSYFRQDRSQKTEVPDFLGSCHELYRITILLASLRT